MIDRMSRFSRNFISLNTLSALFSKIKQRQLGGALLTLHKATAQPEGTHETNQELQDLQEQCK